MARSKIVLIAGIYTVIQAGVQIVFSALAIAQYFCVIDFLQELPLLLYIRILYFHNPVACGPRITIGHAIDGVANQAFVLLRNEPITTFRTFIISCTYLGLGWLWLLASALLMTGGTKSEKSVPIKWPWVLTTVSICSVDVVSTVIFANDTFYTKTLSEVMDYIDGVVSGIGKVELDTSMASWIMTIVYSRFGLFFFLNVLFVVLVAVKKQHAINNVQLEAQILPPLTRYSAAVQTALTTSTEVQTTSTASTEVQTTPMQTSPPAETEIHVQPPLARITEADSDISGRDTDMSSVRDRSTWKIPRADFSYAYRRMKTLLLRKAGNGTPRPSSITYSVATTPERSPQITREGDRKRTVNFPENLLSLPQRLENMIAEQQRRLDQAIIDTSGRHSPPRTSQSLPQLNDTDDLNTNVNRERRGTVADLQGQLPWAYIPASACRMRDQLPPDEDLPPVPLPDYTAIPSFRKASVHRAASSLSSLTHKRDFASQIQRTKDTLEHPWSREDDTVMDAVKYLKCREYIK